MTDVKLTGLTADSAHGFLAALGVLAAVHHHSPNVQLHWSTDIQPHAVLSGIDTGHLEVAILTDRDQRLTGAVLNHPPGNPFTTLKCSDNELHAWATRIGDLPDDDPDIDQWSALIIQGGFTLDGRAKPTHFDFSAARKEFLKEVRNIAQALNEATLNEALYGPWLHTSNLPTLRFEKEGERIQALCAIPPGDDRVKGVPGADWLAWRGLSYYPLSLRHNGSRAHVITPACDADWTNSSYRWPTWTEPSPHNTVAALVTDPRLVGENPAAHQHSRAALQARKIPAIWESGIIRSTQGFGSFSPARQIAYA